MMKKLIAVVFALMVLSLPLWAMADESSVSTPNISVTTTTGSATFTLKSDSKNAKIYYTTNGSDPTTSSKKYSGSVKVTSSCEVRAIAVENGEYSDVGYYTVTVTKARAAAPTFKSTDVDAGKKVTITSSSATIYYTTDGSTPTIYSNKYTSSGITVSESCTIKAIAVRSGYSNSVVSTALVRITKVGQPTLSKTTSSGKTTYKLSNTSPSGCTYYYTTNGSDPTPKTSTTCKKTTGSITITSACTLKVIACKAGYAPSSVYSYKIDGPELTAPTSKQTAVIGGTKVTLTSSVSGVTMYYTTDGTTPTTSSAKYTSSGIFVTEPGTTYIQILMTKSGYTSKLFETKVTLTKLVKPDKPTVSSSTTTSKKLKLTGPTGSTIYYTTNGTDPTTSSKKVSSGGTVSVSNGSTVKLMAAKAGYANSDVLTVTVGTSTTNQVATPTISETKYTDYNKVTLKCSTSGATIYYTLDGSSPLTYGTAVKSGTSIKVEYSCQLRAIAVKDGYTNSNAITYSVILKSDNVTVLGAETVYSGTVVYSNGDVNTSLVSEDVDGIIVYGDFSDQNPNAYFPDIKNEESITVTEVGGTAQGTQEVISLDGYDEASEPDITFPQIEYDSVVIEL